MATVWQGFSVVTKAFTTVNDRWPAIILSAGPNWGVPNTFNGTLVAEELQFLCWTVRGLLNQ